MTTIKQPNAPLTKNEIVAIAKVCHQANKAWCEINGDTSQKDWDDAAEWQRDSMIKGVEFRLENPDAYKDANHIAWMNNKISEGWKYGPVKDAENKTHPCLVPFADLPTHQQKKDYIFCAIVDVLK